MSIQSAMQAGVAGLLAQSTRMAAISDNIANAHTVGYKRSAVDFATLVGGGSPNGYASGGVRASARSEISREGVVQAGASSTDMAISGRGFFPVADRLNPGPGDYMLTRAGSFRSNEDGFLVNAAGHFLQGWPLAQDGSLGVVGRDDFSSLMPVRVGAMPLSGNPTTEISFSGNLPSQQTGLAAPPTPFISSAEYFDPLGASRRLSMEWQPSAVENEWTLTVSDETGPLGSVDVRFNDSGPLAGTPAAYSNVQNLATAPASFAFVDGTITLGLDNGDTPQMISITLGEPDTFDGITQFDGDYRPRVDKDGMATGDLVRVEVTEEGILRGIFSTGASRDLYRIPVADVTNPDGLAPINGNAYKVSIESGSMRLWDAGTGPAGAIAGAALEGSNVDLAEELTALIAAQRAYSSNTKIVQTADEMIDETNRLKR